MQPESTTAPGSHTSNRTCWGYAIVHFNDSPARPRHAASLGQRSLAADGAVDLLVGTNVFVIDGVAFEPEARAPYLELPDGSAIPPSASSPNPPSALPRINW